MTDLSQESETLHESRITSLSVENLRVLSWTKVDQEGCVQINNNNNLRVSKEQAL